MKKMLTSVLLGVLATTTAFSSTQVDGSPTAEAYYHFAIARSLESSGDWEGALEAYQRALELEPTNSLIYSEMAASYLRHNEVSEAIDYAERAIQADRDNLDAHELLSSIYLSIVLSSRSGQEISEEVVELAIEEFEHVVRLNPAERDAYLRLGTLYRVGGDPERAAEVYRDVLEIEPGSEAGALSLAELEIELGNLEEAIEILSRFTQTQPESVAAYVVLGEVYLETGDFGAAADALETAVTLGGEEVELLQNLANALFSAGRLDEAADRYEELIELEPDDPVSLMRMGQIERRQMKFTEAREHLTRAAELVPESSEIRFRLAELDRDEGRFEEAIAGLRGLLDETERINGRYTRGERQNRRMFLTQVAVLHTQLEQYDEAIAVFGEIQELILNRDGTIDSYIVDTYRLADQLDQAADHLNQALASFPDNRQLKLQQADLTAARDDVEEGVRLLRLLMTNQDEDIDVLSAMVGIYERAGDYAAAQGVMTEMMDRFEDSERTHFLQGALYEKQKNLEAAVAAFRRSLEIDADNPAALNYLGYLFADNDRNLEEALEMTQAAVAADPINGAYLDSLGWVYYRLEELELAEQFLKRAVLFSGTDPTLHEHLGDLYQRTGRLQEAEAAYERSLELAEDQEEIDRVQEKLNALRSGPGSI